MKLINKKIFSATAIFVLMMVFLSANFSSAAFLNPEAKQKIENQSHVAGFYGYDTSGDIFGLIQLVINGFLALIGVLLLAYLLYAGYKWMTAHGEEEKVTQAKDSIRQAIIGIIIIIGAYAISVFVMSRLEVGTLRSSGGAAPATQAPANGGGGG